MNFGLAIIFTILVVFLLEIGTPYADYIWKSKVLKTKRTIYISDRASKIFVYLKVGYYASIIILLLFSINGSKIALYSLLLYTLIMFFIVQIDNKFMK